MLLTLDHASESPGELAKPWLTGPHLLTFWFSSSGMGPENLHVWQVAKWHWWCYCRDDTWRTTALNNLVILSWLYFYHLMGSRRVGHDWATSLSLFTFTHWKRKWQPTLVFLPGESQGWGSLAGCRLWGRTELDMTWSDLAGAGAACSSWDASVVQWLWVVWLCNPVNCSLPGSSVQGFSRKEYWSGLLFRGNPGIEPISLSLMRVLYH